MKLPIDFTPYFKLSDLMTKEEKIDCWCFVNSFVNNHVDCNYEVNKIANPNFSKLMWVSILIFESLYDLRVVVITPFLSWNVLTQNDVNDVDMLVWIPTVEINAKA